MPAITWTLADAEAARECERLFQNGGPRVYVTSDRAVLRPCILSATREAGAADVGQTVYARRKRRETGRYEWFAHSPKAAEQERPGRALHRAAHAQPKPAPDLVHSFTMTDGHGKRFVVDVEVRSSLIAQALGHYARTNAGKLSKACDGGVIVRFIREVA